MRTYADASFLIALYRPDSFSETATLYMARHSPSLILTLLQIAEIRNSLRLQVARKLRSSDEVVQYLAIFERDMAEDFFEALAPQWETVFENFEKISHRYTMREGHRFVDTLHVAMALSFKASHFLTFDQRQARLAQAEGMKTPLALQG